MRHFANPEFWESYAKLPPRVRRLADKKFELLKSNPQHPSLHLKKIGSYWSVRIGLDYRALSIEGGSGLIWFWIGPHDEYERMLD
jgi:mRNA-degrading endonuclease RelE of RelBE toxin-antitoxin system